MLFIFSLKNFLQLFIVVYEEYMYTSSIRHSDFFSVLLRQDSQSIVLWDTCQVSHFFFLSKQLFWLE